MHIDRETWSICGFLSWNTRLYAGRTLKGYFRHVSVGFSRMVDYNHIHHEISGVNLNGFKVAENHQPPFFCNRIVRGIATRLLCA